MGRYDYRTNDLLGAARYAAIYCDHGLDVPDEPSLAELEADELYVGDAPALSDADREAIAVAFDEVYGPAPTVADLPF